MPVFAAMAGCRRWTPASVRLQVSANAYNWVTFAAVSGAAKLNAATLADLLAIPEERRRHEIIEGVLVEKEAASGRHGGAQVRLSRRLGPYDRRPGGRGPGGWWFATEVEIALSETDVFRPDVSGARRTSCCP